MSPIAANLVRLMEQARQAREMHGFSGFYPQWWMLNKILEVGNDYSSHWRRRVLSEKEALQREGINTDIINLRPELSDRDLEDRQQFFRDIQAAYGIAAYSQFTPRQKHVFREELRQDIRKYNIGNVTLNEQQRDLLTQIGRATNTPVDSDKETYHFFTVLQQPDITEEEMQEDPRYNT